MKINNIKKVESEDPKLSVAKLQSCSEKKLQFRKKFILEKEFQYSFIARNLLILIFAFFMLFLVVKVWERQQVKRGVYLGAIGQNETRGLTKANYMRPNSMEFVQVFLKRAQLYTVFDQLLKPFVIVLVLNIMVLVLLNVYFLHKVLGPIHRLNKILENRLAGKETDPIIFRKNDAFHEFAEVINNIVLTETEKKHEDEKDIHS